jgi:hypothetical protein
MGAPWWLLKDEVLVAADVDLKPLLDSLPKM